MQARLHDRIATQAQFIGNERLAPQVAWRTDMYSMQLLVSPAEALRRCWADADAFFGRCGALHENMLVARNPVVCRRA